MDLKSNSAHQNAARWKLPAADLLDSHTSTSHRLNRRKRDAFGKPTKDWTPSRNIRVVISKTLLHEELFTANKPCTPAWTTWFSQFVPISVLP